MIARRSGLTLMELLLVLAVIVVIGALTIPSLATPMENQRLRKAADVIRAEWSTARVQAMKSGRIHLFRFEQGGDHYGVEPWAGAGDDLQSTNDQAVKSSGGGLVTSQGVAAAQKQLPDGVVFGQGMTANDNRANFAMQAGGNDAAPVSAATASYANSPPVLFYPDGTTSTARIMLTNRRQRYVVINLRGLTGMTQVSDLLSAEELPQ